MENASEALIMAFGVLIFVLALSISISVFTQARVAVDAVVDTVQEEESFVKDGNGKYLNYVNFDIASGGTRTVGVDTIVSTMYRAYKENFKIYFYGIDGITAGCDPQYDIDEETNKKICYGLQYDIDEETNEKIYYIDLSRQVLAPGQEEEYVNNVLSRNNNKFYKYLAGKKFTEKLGEYYQNDEGEIADIATVNKTKKRIIIYRVQD